jgi:Sulfotransferase domain
LPARTLPNFVVVGATQAGTATMFDALSGHPQICASSTRETRYFQPVRYNEPLPPLSAYHAYFRRYAGEPVVMESTPDYFYGGAATARMIQEVCDPRVTVVLREPLDRLISFYRLMQNRLQVPRDMTLRDYVSRCQAVPESDMNQRASYPYSGLWGGQYARHLPDWLTTFAGRIDIFFYDELSADPAATLADQCSRLGIDPAVVDSWNTPEATTVDFRSPAAQRAAVFAAKRSRALFRRYPSVYTRGRQLYEAANQREGSSFPVAATLRREIGAIYRPWNELLTLQLRDAGVNTLPGWLTQ